MTVVEVIQRGSEFLTQKGIESPRLQMELMLAHLLQLPRLNLYLNFDRTITEAEAEALRKMVKRRSLHEPLQHILGSVCFCGLDFAVNSHVLVPRPETELLAEATWEAARRLVGAQQVPRLLDFGTGSGCLAVTVAVHCPEAQVEAVDISAEALVVARANAERHQVAQRINFHCGALPAASRIRGRFNLAVSNPPYVPTGEIASLMPEVRDFDPRIALDGGEDGLDFYRLLAAEVHSLLQPGGELFLEVGDGQGAPVEAILQGQGWTITALRKDYSGRDRILIARASN